MGPSSSQPRHAGLWFRVYGLGLRLWGLEFAGLLVSFGPCRVLDSRIVSVPKKGSYFITVPGFTLNCCQDKGFCLGFESVGVSGTVPAHSY